MLKLWNALEKRFYVTGRKVDPATRYMALIAKLLFWWMYAEGHMGSSARRKNFVAFFGLDDA